MKQHTHRNKISFIQWFVALFITAVIGCVSFLNSISYINAANLNNVTVVDGLSATSSGDGNWTSDSRTIVGNVTASSKTEGCDTTYTARTGTLNLTNSLDKKGLLEFDYTVELSGGSVNIDGTNVQSNGSFSKTIDSGSSKTISITSNGSDSTATTVSLTNISFTPEQDVTVTFKAPINGSYTVDGTPITSDILITKLTTQTYSLSATPASGYSFFGWFSETINDYVSKAQSATISFASDTTVRPVFVLSSQAIFYIGNQYYMNLTEAVNGATSDDKIVKLARSGTISGNYIIPSGIVLLIPYNEDYTYYSNYTDENIVVYGSHSTPTAFRTLTLSSSSSITIQNGGSMCVMSILSATGTGSGSWNGTPTGPGGRVVLQDTTSSITVNSGASLCAYGYISGNGTVIANSGSTIYEAFQLRCWRGGTVTSGMTSGIFPLPMYYVQNIECTLRLYSGAKEYINTSANMSNDKVPAFALFIGGSSDTAMFRITNGYIEKRFDGPKDYLIIDVYGDVYISSFSIKIYVTINTNNYDEGLPLNCNIGINIHKKNISGTISGSTVIINQHLAMLPGSYITIDEDCKLTVASGVNVYIWDSSDWIGKKFGAADADIVVVGYSVANGTTTKRTAAGLVDAKIDINGEMQCSGKVYTTTNGATSDYTNGANVTSSNKNGRITMSTIGSDTETKAKQNKSEISVTITSVLLKNDDNYSPLYTTTKNNSGVTFEYNVDHWENADNIGNKETLTFYNAGAPIEKTYTPGVDTVIFPTVQETPLFNNQYTVKKWESFSGVVYNPGQQITQCNIGTDYFNAIYGGWLYDTSSSAYKFIDYDTGEYKYGFYEIEHIFTDSGQDELFGSSVIVHVGDTCYFDLNTGLFSAETGVKHYGTEDYYYCVDGILQKDSGLIYIDTDSDGFNDSYYYIQQNNKACVGGPYLLSNKLNDLLPAGYYMFDDEGKLIIPGQIDHLQEIGNEIFAKDINDNTVFGYGLFSLQNGTITHLYYCKQDGTIVKNTTFYVEKTNNYYIDGISTERKTIKEGLYYFDENGFMWYGNELLDDTSAEFSPIVSTSTITIGGGN